VLSFLAASSNTVNTEFYEGSVSSSSLDPRNSDWDWTDWTASLVALMLACCTQDKYILSSMALLCSVCLWHAVVGWIQSRLVDLLVLVTFAGVYLLSHLAFYIFIYVVVSCFA